MKKILFIVLGCLTYTAQAQVTPTDSIVKPITIDSLQLKINEHVAKFNDLDERLAVMDGDLSKLTKIKISGYIQAQYDMYDHWGAAGHGFQVVPGSGSGATAVAPDLITNSFFIRRARVKFTYETLEGVKFVLQPDFAFDRVTMKDVYVVLNDRWTNTYSLYLGQFNRPNYDVELSSNNREFLERARMTTTIYPTERDLGAKVEANFINKYNVPLKLQLAAFNGNFGYGTTSNQTRDVDSNKDIMARALYSFSFPTKGLDIDLGAHGFFGSTKILPGTTILDASGNTTFTDENNNPFTPKVGDALKKNWFGGEMQLYYDFLGGLAIKTEYIAGTFSGTNNAAQLNTAFTGNKVRDFAGYYASFIKNIGKHHQAVVRYDSFDPNSKLSGDAVKTANDLKYDTWSLGWQYFYDENVKIVLSYVMPKNEISNTVGGDFVKDRKDNTFTIRLQASF